MNIPHKVYLGASVYAEIDDDGLLTLTLLTLTTAIGFGQSNTVYLDPDVYAALVAYVTALQPAGAGS